MNYCLDCQSTRIMFGKCCQCGSTRIGRWYVLLSPVNSS